MKILLTGATSGLGRNAAQWLLEQGHQVIASGRDPRVGERLTALGATFRPGDLSTHSVEQCRQLMHDCEAVWHCAALSAPWGSQAAFYASNVQASDRLAQAAGQLGVPRFVHISTPAIYFNFHHRHDVDESQRATRFANHYASSKFVAEQRILQRVKQFPATRYSILRPRGIFGPHDRVILPRILQQIERDRGVLRLPRAGQALLDLTFVLNVVEAMWQATAHQCLPSGGIYNITNHQPQPLAGMLHQLLVDGMGMALTIKAVPYPLLYALAGSMEAMASLSQKEPALTRYSVGAVNFDMTLSQTRARQELHYQPRYSLAQGIEQTAHWLRQQGRK